MYDSITEITPFEILDNGSARFYVEQGIVESVFYGFHLLCITGDMIYFYNEDDDIHKNSIKIEALNIMMKQTGIENYDLIPGTVSKKNYEDRDISILKFKDEADEAFFKMHFINAFYNNTKYKPVVRVK